MVKRALCIRFGYNTHLGGEIEKDIDFEDMNNLLTSLGYSTVILKDDTPKIKRTLGFRSYPRNYSTRKNVLKALTKIIRVSVPGDQVFIYYKGYGCKPLVSRSKDGYNESLFDSKGRLLWDNMIKVCILDKLRVGVKIICLWDCSRSGVGLELPYIYTEKEGLSLVQDSQRISKSCFSKRVTDYSTLDVTSFSLDTSRLSAWDTFSDGKTNGLLTKIFLKVLGEKDNNGYDVKEFIRLLNKEIDIPHVEVRLSKSNQSMDEDIRV